MPPPNSIHHHERPPHRVFAINGPGCYARRLLRPGSAACVARVFQPAGARDFPVPCSGPPRHRAHAIPHHPQSYIPLWRKPDAHEKVRNTGLESPVRPPTKKSALRLPHQHPNESRPIQPNRGKSSHSFRDVWAEPCAVLRGEPPFCAVRAFLRPISFFRIRVHSRLRPIIGFAVKVFSP